MVTNRARRPRTVVAVVALAAALAGCGAEGGDSSAPTDTAPHSPDGTPASTATRGTASPTAATDTAPPTATDGTASPTAATHTATRSPDGTTASTATDGTPSGGEVPAGFPDPESLVGQEAYDERGADGNWDTVVGGEPLGLVNTFGACFAGDTDVCSYSISGSAPAGPDGAPTPSDAALLLLLRWTGEQADGTPTWEVLDATITRPPEPPAFLQVCDGEEGVAFYPAGDAGDSEWLPVAAAWGPNGDLTELVELDPDEVTCRYVGH